MFGYSLKNSICHLLNESYHMCYNFALLQYSVDPSGLHHLVPPAPLECKYCTERTLLCCVCVCDCEDQSTGSLNASHYFCDYCLIEGDEGQKAYGLFEVYKDKLKLKWTGKEPSDSMLPWENTQHMSFK